MKRQKGYTLIELMTTLAVATVLISVAMPGMQSIPARLARSMK
jgi:prepilin-type N-terminal cleavage/methylation domain-containing protein